MVSSLPRRHKARLHGHKEFARRTEACRLPARRSYWPLNGRQRSSAPRNSWTKFSLQTASVAENPAVMHDPFTRPERINVPTFFETGTAETLCPEAGVVEAYNKDPMHDKVLMDTIGGTHFEETNIGRKRVLPYSVQFLVCHLMDDPKACNYIYGKGKDSLCTIGNVPYKKCHALHSMRPFAG